LKVPTFSSLGSELKVVLKMAADEQLALLASITCMDIDLCRVMLARAGGDLNLAAQHMTSEGVRSRCAECGKEGDGYYGQGTSSVERESGR